MRMEINQEITGNRDYPMKFGGNEGTNVGD